MLIARSLAWLSQLWSLNRGRPVAAAILAVFAVLQLSPAWLSVISPVRLALYDEYQKVFPRLRETGPATVVAIDEDSLKELGTWPWPRDRMAALIKAIARHQPAAIGLDIYMPEPDPTSPEALAASLPENAAGLKQSLAALPAHDAILARMLRDVPYVVLGAAGVDNKTFNTREGLRIMAQYQFSGGNVDDARNALRKYPYVLASLPELQAAAAGQALLSIDLEKGVVRRAPLLLAVNDALVPALATEMLRIGLGEKNIGVKMDSDGIAALTIGGLHIPTQPNGEIWIHFSEHNAHNDSRSVSAKDVLNGKVADDMLAGKLVLVGLTGIGMMDYRTTARGDFVPGIDIQAQLLESLFDRHFLQRPHWVVQAELAALIIGGLILIWAVPGVRPRTAVLLTAVLCIALFGAGFALFHLTHVLFDAVTPFVGFSAIFISLLSSVFIKTDRDRRTAESALYEEREAAAKIAGELGAARRIQLGSLPQARQLFANEHRFDIDGFLEPAREVGGDLYDFFMLDEHRLFFIIGDVSGKGLPAALFMAVSKALAKSLALRGGDNVGAVLRATDVELSRENPEMFFVTVVAGILDVKSGMVELSNAGHDAPWRITRDGHANHLEIAGGPPLCVLEGYQYENSRIQLEPGDALCLITDGVTEAMNEAGELYGSERLRTVLKTLPPYMKTLVAAVREDVRRFVGNNEASDDITLLALRWNGPEDAVSAR